MIARHAMTLVSLALALLAAPAHAGPCTQQIYDFDIALNKKLQAAAAAGKAGAQSLAATTHRQPTPKSIEQAEVQLGDISAANAEAFTKAMDDARKADAASDLAGCEKALKAARQMLDR
jgi:hypothetical protein